MKRRRVVVKIEMVVDHWDRIRWAGHFSGADLCDHVQFRIRSFVSVLVGIPVVNDR